MTGQRYLGLLLVAGMTASAGAQTAGQPAAPGEMPAPAVNSETAYSNVIITGVKVSNDFDDNAGTSTIKQTNLATVLEPFVGWNFSQKRMKLGLDYRPGFSWNSPLTQYNFRSQQFDATLQYKLSNRMLLNFRNNFDMTTNAFDRLRNSQFAPQFGVLDRPNDSFLLPSTRRTSELAVVDLTYELSPHTVAGAGGSFTRLQYHALNGTSASAPKPANTTAEGGHAFLNQHITPRNWIGVEYNVNDFHSPNQRSDFLIQSAYYTHSVNLNHGMVFSLFAGPEYSRSHGVFQLDLGPFLLTIPSFSAHWSWAGGATYSWTGMDTSFTLDAARQISDGAGLSVAVRLERFQAELRRRLTRKWTMSLLGNYAKNRMIERLAGNGSLDYASASIGLRRALTRDLALDLRYWRTQQSLTGTSFGLFPVNHNRASITLSYQFTHPLGK